MHPLFAPPTLERQEEERQAQAIQHMGPLEACLPSGIIRCFDLILEGPRRKENRPTNDQNEKARDAIQAERWQTGHRDMGSSHPHISIVIYMTKGIYHQRHT